MQLLPHPEAQQQHTKMMAQFADLSDEIGADDWTIAPSEITRRRLVKQTPRYRIYKADWFGDVMVYEPVVRREARVEANGERKRRSRRPAKRTYESYRPEIASSALVATNDQQNQDQELREKLSLILGATRRNEDQASLSSLADSVIDFCESSSGNDSAYSSCSSTPQHSPKQEFQFPVQTQAFIRQQQEMADMRQEEAKTTSWPLQGSRIVHKRSPSPSSPPVVLNRDSFPFGFGEGDLYEDDDEEAIPIKSSMSSRLETEAQETEAKVTTTTTASWFELNELRLVAHENFMLFLGASIEPNGEWARNMQDQLEQTSSLVMQMSHPKSVSLEHLLHANKWSGQSSSSSPHLRQQQQQQMFSQQTNSFFQYSPYNQLRKQPTKLTTAAKLNICQQVTDAMTYLHGKNIVHGRLTSANVYIEPNERVKISLIDTDERQMALGCVCGGPSACKVVADELRLKESQEGQAGNSEANEFVVANSGAAFATTTNNNNTRARQEPLAASLNLTTLTYLSPELIRTIRLVPPSVPAVGETADPCDCNDPQSHQHRAEVQMDTSLLTKEADVFSFGTLLFELFQERFPFAEVAKSAPVRSPRDEFLFGQNLSAKSAPKLSPRGPNGPIRSPLFHSLCLDTPPATPRSGGYITPHHQMSLGRVGQPLPAVIMPSPARGMPLSNGNIRASASELIYQIGSGQIAQRNHLVKVSNENECPALVERIISLCWSSRPHERPAFKQLRFD